MFGFGRDLRRLFAQARDGRDRTWIELIGVDLLEMEARGQASVQRPSRRSMTSGLKAAGLWREHARRTGLRLSLERAMAEAGRSAEAAMSSEQYAEAALEIAMCLMLQYELRGGPELLDRAESFLDGHSVLKDRALNARLRSAAARLAALKARHAGETMELIAASTALDAALCDLIAHEDLAAEASDVQLDSAALKLEAGLALAHAEFLEQAGRDLRLLVRNASPDYRPVTRARALTLCAAGLSALAGMTGDEAAREQAEAMFDAAADAFTPDHSPLDWAAIELARTVRDPQADISRLIRVEAVTGNGGLILGAIARERRTAAQVGRAARKTDDAELIRIQRRLLQRLSRRDASDHPLDWAVDQIGLAQIGLVFCRLSGDPEPLHLGLMLTEAGETARDLGAGLIADRAETLLSELSQISRASRS